MLNAKDLELLAAKGISEKQIEEQLACFVKGFPFLEITASASVERGIMVIPQEKQAPYMDAWDAYLAKNKKIVKFVPASGAASRMFKNLYEFLSADYNEPQNAFEKKFFDDIRKFAFYDALNRACIENEAKDIPALIALGQYKAVVSNLLESKGLNYGQLPKGLLLFHSYPQTARTAGGETGIYNSALVNTGLRWEQSQSFEAGLDIGFFNNRLSFILDYYNRKTKDLLTDLALPGYTGFDKIATNLGTLRNSGFEAEVRANIINKGGFTWDMTANLSTVANKIIKLPDNKEVNNRVGGAQVWDPNKGELVWVGGRQEGGKLGELIAYKQNHIFKDWDDVKKYANNRIDNVANLYGPGKAAEYAGKQGWKPIEPGDVCWEDMDGNDVIDSYDRYVVGNIFPNITGGFSTTFSYKNWSLYGRFDYALGHTLYNDLKARTLGQYQGTWNIITDVKDMWTEDNPNTDLSKYYFGDQNIKKNITRSNNGLTAADNNNSHYYEKGDYLCLRELTLSYTLPKSLISKCFMTDASVYVTGQNLFYITGYEGTSPEPAVSTEYGRGIDNGRYPTPRTVLFGLSVSF